MAILRAASTKKDDKQVVAGSTDDADKPTTATRPTGQYQAFGAVVFVAGYLIGLAILGSKHPGLKHLPLVATGVSVFAVLYVYAQAIERLLVPVSWVGGGFLDGTTKTDVKQATQRQLVALANADPDDASFAEKKKKAANAQHGEEQYRANLTATTFGVGGLLACIACGYSGTLLLHIIGVKTAGWLDLLVTGLAIAGGTKPLHDLISNMTTSSAAKSAAS